MFANGVSPRAIARRLNEEGVPGPEDRLWQDTTIRGQKERGTGLLNNELYIGEMVWNRCSYVKDPRTGKRVARPNPPAQWERTPVPDLRIIADELWHAVKRRQEATTFEMARDERERAQPRPPPPLPALRPADLRLLRRRLHHHGARTATAAPAGAPRACAERPHDHPPGDRGAASSRRSSRTC